MISNNSISRKTKLIKDKAESCHINCNHDIFYEKIAEGSFFVPAEEKCQIEINGW